MKKRILTLVLSVLLLTSCGGGAGSAGTSGSSSEAGGSSHAQGEVQPAYFGDWTVSSSPGSAPGCPLSQEEMDALLGTALSYAQDAFTTGGQSWELPSGAAYGESIVTAQDFETACQLAPSELGVSASMLLHVTVNLQGDDLLLGRDFFVLNSDSLLLYHDGAFFLAERAD